MTDLLPAEPAWPLSAKDRMQFRLYMHCVAKGYTGLQEVALRQWARQAVQPSPSGDTDMDEGGDRYIPEIAPDAPPGFKLSNPAATVGAAGRNVVANINDRSHGMNLTQGSGTNGAEEWPETDNA